jgi:uncharacterized protein YndB with AHSA1/START domain
MKPPDQARVTTFVEVCAQDAFDVFTRETDCWWRHGPRFRFGGERRGMLGFEGGAGGRLLETFADGSQFVVGRVLAWEPGARLRFEWRGADFARDETTEVEVWFEGRDGGTQVTLEHRGWAALRPGHPARRGLDGDAFTDMIGLRWGELLTTYRAHVSRYVRAAASTDA